MMNHRDSEQHKARGVRELMILLSPHARITGMFQANGPKKQAGVAILSMHEALGSNPAL